MTPTDVNEYVGLPWQSGAYGPQAFNCWGLLYEVQRRFFNVQLPQTELGDEAAAMYRDKMMSGDWEIVPAPFHGAGVLLRGGNVPHVGVWLDIGGGGALHSMEGYGVIFTPRKALRMLGFSRIGFYRFHV